MFEDYRVQKFRIGGLISVCLCLISILLAIGSKEQHSATNQLHEPASTINDQASSGEYQPDCDKKKNADLCAQRRMADAAENQSLWTLISLVLLFLTLGAAAWAAWEARNAARAAMEGVSIAQTTNDTTRDAFFVDQRPWVTIKTIKCSNAFIVPRAEERRANFGFDCQIVFANSGKTPAIDVRYVIVGVPRASELSEEVVRSNLDRGGSNATIGPNAEIGASSDCSLPFEFRKGEMKTTIGIGILVQYCAAGCDETFETIEISGIFRKSENFPPQEFLIPRNDLKDYQAITFPVKRHIISSMT